MIKEEILQKLYLSKKMSMKEISRQINKNERQVDYWMRKYNIKTRSISEAIYHKKNKNGDPFKIPKFLNNKNIYKNKIFLYGLGLGLYWGEGTKRSPNSIRLGNSDPRLIKKFLTFLEEIFKIKKYKVRFGLQIFSDMPEREVIRFWQTKLGVGKDLFYKTIITKSGKVGKYKNKSKYGVLTIYFNNKKLKDFIFEKVSIL